MYKMYREAGGNKEFKSWLEQAKSENTISSFSHADGENPNEKAPFLNISQDGIPMRNIVVGGILLIGIGYLAYTYLWKGKVDSAVAEVGTN